MTTNQMETVKAELDLGDTGVSELNASSEHEGGWGGWILGTVVVLAVLAGIAWGGIRFLAAKTKDPYAAMLTAPVKRAELVVGVTEDGNLESAVNIDIKCEVAGGTAILWIVEDGKEVEQGEKLVQLDSSTLEEQINQQRITFEKARAAKIQAEKDFEAAKLAVDEYMQGTFVQQLQDQEAQITIALENLRSSENSLEHAERMFRKGYISALDLESQRFSVKRAQLELDSAKTAKEVLVKYTKIKTVQDLESQRDSNEAKMRSEDASFSLEESRLKRLEAQLEHCVITAPAAGMVVYANEQRSRFGGSQSSQIEEGAMVRERQTILRLPDLSKMQVKVNVHESKVEQLGLAWKKAITEGQTVPARIRIQDRVLNGSLISIANQPEASGWWTGNVKEYATIVAIVGTPQGLRPGMTAECEILVEDLNDVLTLPVAAVVEQAGAYFCWVKTPTGVQRRPLIIGATNDQFVEAKDGVQAGEQVVLNPRAMIEEARAVKDAVISDEDKEKTGKKGHEPARKSAAGKRPVGKSPAGKRPEAASTGPSAVKGAGRPGHAPGGPPAKEPGRRPGGGGRRSMDLMQYDKNGDGKVSKDEAPSFMNAFFDRIDADGDGMIDRAEIKKARDRMQKQ